MIPALQSCFHSRDSNGSIPIANLSTIRMSGHKNWNHIFKFFSDKYLDSESRLYFAWNISVNDVIFLSHVLDLVTRSSSTKFVGEEHETRSPERVHGSLSIEYMYLLLSLQRQRFQTCNPKRVNWNTSAVLEQLFQTKYAANASEMGYWPPLPLLNVHCSCCRVSPASLGP